MEEDSLFSKLALIVQTAIAGVAGLVGSCMILGCLLLLLGFFFVIGLLFWAALTA